MTDPMLSVAIILATLLGPIFAVLVTRWQDDKARRRHRQAETFRTLMATRSATISAEHVGALNTIEVDFYGVQSVESALNNYVTHLNNGAPAGAPESAAHAWNDRQRDLLAILLAKMAVAIGVTKSEIEIRQGGYSPMGWFQKEQRQNAAQGWILDLAAGKAAVPIKIVDAPPSA
jgi:hypothetical protein